MRTYVRNVPGNGDLNLAVLKVSHFAGFQGTLHEYAAHWFPLDEHLAKPGVGQDVDHHFRMVCHCMPNINITRLSKAAHLEMEHTPGIKSTLAVL